MLQARPKAQDLAVGSGTAAAAQPVLLAGSGGSPGGRGGKAAAAEIPVDWGDVWRHAMTDVEVGHWRCYSVIVVAPEQCFLVAAVVHSLSSYIMHTWLWPVCCQVASVLQSPVTIDGPNGSHWHLLRWRWRRGAASTTRIMPSSRRQRRL